MATLYIGPLNFGITKSKDYFKLDAGNNYEVTDTLAELFNSWFFRREPEQFLGGLIADRMKEEGEGKDGLWWALVTWMEWVFQGEERIGRLGWLSAIEEHTHKSNEVYP